MGRWRGHGGLTEEALIAELQVTFSLTKQRRLNALNRISDINAKAILLAGFSVCLLPAVALTVGMKTRSQQPQVPSQNNKDSLLRQVESSQELPLGVARNDDCPLRIVQATVKEISGSDFSRLTGRTTELATVSSVPEVRLVNASGETITGFVLAIRDPQSRRTRGFVQEKISVASGETYIVKRQHFVEPEKATIASENGQVQHTVVLPGMDSEKYWLQFAGRADVFVTIGKVTFSSGRSWIVKE